MQVNIIHLPERKDRWSSLVKELEGQEILDYKIWNGIVDPYLPPKGISKAHKQIVQYASDNNIPEVLIAEDDLKFTDKEAFKFFIKQKPPEFDLYLASIYLGFIDEQNIVEDFSGLTFYIISKKFYSTFLSMPEYDNLDRQLNGKGKFVVCNPFTVIQYNGYSDNVKTYCNYDSYLQKRKIFRKARD